MRFLYMLFGDRDLFPPGRARGQPGRDDYSYEGDDGSVPHGTDLNTAGSGCCAEGKRKGDTGVPGGRRGMGARPALHGPRGSARRKEKTDHQCAKPASPLTQYRVTSGRRLASPHAHTRRAGGGARRKGRGFRRALRAALARAVRRGSAVCTGCGSWLRCSC